MASTKDLKRDINDLTYDLVDECFTYMAYHPEKEKEGDEIIRKIITERNNLIHRVNNPEVNTDPKKLKAHFNKIKADIGKLIKLVEDLSKDA